MSTAPANNVTDAIVPDPKTYKWKTTRDGKQMFCRSRTDPDGIARLIYSGDVPGYIPRPRKMRKEALAAEGKNARKKRLALEEAERAAWTKANKRIEEGSPDEMMDWTEYNRLQVVMPDHDYDDDYDDYDDYDCE